MWSCYSRQIDLLCCRASTSLVEIEKWRHAYAKSLDFLQTSRKHRGFVCVPLLFAYCGDFDVRLSCHLHMRVIHMLFMWVDFENKLILIDELDMVRVHFGCIWCSIQWNCLSCLYNRSFVRASMWHHIHSAAPQTPSK